MSRRGTERGAAVARVQANSPGADVHMTARHSSNTSADAVTGTDSATTDGCTGASTERPVPSAAIPPTPPSPARGPSPSAASAAASASSAPPGPSRTDRGHTLLTVAATSGTWWLAALTERHRTRLEAGRAAGTPLAAPPPWPQRWDAAVAATDSRESRTASPLFSAVNSAACCCSRGGNDTLGRGNRVGRGPRSRSASRHATRHARTAQGAAAAAHL